MHQQTICIIDDDSDDQELITEIFEEMQFPYRLEFFIGAEPLLKRMENGKDVPFIIICDVNLPTINGFELRERLLKDRRTEAVSVPFIFWSSYASPAQIRHAYELKAHGFFIKEQRYQDWKVTLIQIIQYWQKSRIPDETS